MNGEPAVVFSLKLMPMCQPGVVSLGKKTIGYGRVDYVDTNLLTLNTSNSCGLPK